MLYFIELFFILIFAVKICTPIYGGELDEKVLSQELLNKLRELDERYEKNRKLYPQENFSDKNDVFYRRLEPPYNYYYLRSLLGHKVIIPGMPDKNSNDLPQD